MNENEFRGRLRDALGEPPPLPLPKLRPSDAGAGRAYPRAMATLAIALAVLLVLVLVASRIALRPQGMNLPAAKPSGVAQVGPDAFPCSLAVMAVSEAENPGQNPATSASLGFVNIPAGTFRMDPTPTVSGLPGGSAAESSFYSAELKRWVPASARTISPDGLAYAYVMLLPAGATYSNFTSSELHTYDVARKADRMVWSYAAGVEIIAWDAAGIIVSTVPPQGGIRLLWRVDPAGGGASQASQESDPSWLPMALARTVLPHGGNYGYLGSDHGRAVFRIGSRDRGTKYSVVAIESGQATTLYAGTAGDSTDFDPTGVYSDGHGLWLGNFDGSRVWLWSRSTGLQSFKVSGLPQAPSGYAYSNVNFAPAGACVPGVFDGVAAKALPPAPTPSPSPTPPTIDWSTLTAKPLNLQPLPSGASCPVSAQVNFTLKAQSGKWPPYGFGQGPVYVSGQFTWYSSGTQGVVILTDPKYTGPVLVRSRRLDGTGSLTFSGQDATSLADGAIGLAQTSSPPYWGTWFGTLTASAPGCYGIQFDGSDFSGTAVIAVSTAWLGSARARLRPRAAPQAPRCGRRAPTAKPAAPAR